MNTYQTIRATVNATFDSQFSRAAIEGFPIEYKWTFTNQDYSSTRDTVTTTQPSISYGPRYEGTYKVTVRIFDGTYSDTIDLGLVYYKNGRVPCTGTVCQQPL